MPSRKNESRKDEAVTLLCPSCGKRLPASGTLSMYGTAGLFCRHCHRTVQVTIEVADKESCGGGA